MIIFLIESILKISVFLDIICSSFWVSIWSGFEVVFGTQNVLKIDFGPLLDRPWAPRGGQGRLGAVLGPSWGGLGASWGGLGVVLGRVGAVLGRSWGVLGRSWGGLGASWVGLGASCGPKGGGEVQKGSFWVVWATWGCSILFLHRSGATIGYKLALANSSGKRRLEAALSVFSCSGLGARPSSWGGIFNHFSIIFRASIFD